MKNHILINPLIIEQSDASDFYYDLTGEDPEKKEEEPEEEEDDSVTGQSPAEFDPTDPETWIPYLKQTGIEFSEEFQDWSEEDLDRYFQIAQNAAEEVTRDVVVFGAGLSEEAYRKLKEWEKQLEESPKELEKWMNDSGLGDYELFGSEALYKYDSEILNWRDEESRADAYVQRFEEILNNIINVIFGLDFQGAAKAYELIGEGKFEEAWDEIKPNINTLLDEAVLALVGFHQKPVIDDDGNVKGYEEVPDDTRQAIKATLASITLSITMIFARSMAKRSALRKLAKIAKNANFNEQQMVDIAKKTLRSDLFSNELFDWFRNDKKFAEEVLNAAKQEGHLGGKKWGDATASEANRFVQGIKDAFKFTGGRVAASALNPFLLVAEKTFNAKFQSEIQKASIAEFVRDAEQLTNVKYDTLDDAKKALAEIIDEYGAKRDSMAATLDDKLYRSLEKSITDATSKHMNAIEKASLHKDLAKKRSGVRRAIIAWSGALPPAQKLSLSEINALADQITEHGFPNEKNIDILEKKYIKAKDLADNAAKVSREMENKLAVFLKDKAAISWNATKKLIRGSVGFSLDAYDRAIFGGLMVLDDLDDWATNYSGTTGSAQGSALRKAIDRIKSSIGTSRMAAIDATIDAIESGLRKTISAAHTTSVVVTDFTKKPRSMVRALFDALRNLKEQQGVSSPPASSDPVDFKFIEDAIQSMTNQAELEAEKIDLEIKNLEDEVIKKVVNSLNMVKDLSAKMIKDDLQDALGKDFAVLATKPLPTQTPANESKIRITKSKLIDLISEQVKEQTQTVDVDKDQLVALVAEEAFKQINRKK